MWSINRFVFNNSGLDGRGLSVCWIPDCRCRRLLLKSRRLPFSGFLPLNAENCKPLQRTHLQWPLLRMSPTARDETSRGRSLCSKHTYSDYSWRCLPQPGMKHTGEGILRMEDTRILKEKDTDSQDSNIPIDHGHLAQSCLIKIVTLAMKVFVIEWKECWSMKAE